ncbi:MAG: hypothetical protein JST73_05060, partial [Actinobacteria bacterium]|nr:hypothetical protein [Actinomycetota bacterium]
VLATVTPSAPSAIATTALRLSANDAAGAHALAHGRPVDDDLGAALRIMDARASTLDGESSVALTEITNLVDSHAVSRPIDRLARVARVAALRAAGRDQEADLIDDEFMRGGGDPATPRTETEPSVPVEAEPERPAEPQPPLFGRSLADALDDAWARVRRQPLQGALDPLTDRARIEGLCDEAVALIGAGHTESAEATLLLHMDTVDAQVDAGGVVVDDFFVLLAGMFDRLGLTTEEAATLERLRSAHQRAGSELPGPIEERLVEIRAMLDDLG